MTPRQSAATVFRVGHGLGGRWREATDAALRQIGRVSPEANLGFLYVSDRFVGDVTAVDRKSTRLNSSH